MSSPNKALKATRKVRGQGPSRRSRFGPLARRYGAINTSSFLTHRY